MQIVVWGAQGHAKVVVEAIRLGGRWRIAGFIDDMAPQRAGEAFAGAQVLGGREVLPSLRAAGVKAMALAFGNNPGRWRLMNEMRALGFEFPPLVHPSAVVAADAELGEGCFIGPLAVVNPAARIGSQTIVNSAAVVEHDCVIGHAAHLSPRACLAGNVTVGDFSWIGAGSTVREKLSVGSEVTVGMGSVVVHSLPSRVVAYGCPARIRATLPQHTE